MAKLTSRSAFGLALVSFVALAAPALAETPEIMMAQCRNRAGEALKVRLPDIDTKYEGQRTDGTHAVNGTSRTGDRVRTFQCSFNRAGSRIVNFVVNQAASENAGSAQTAIASDTIRFARGATSAALKGSIKGRQSRIYRLSAQAGQTMNVSLSASNTATYFNVYEPGKGEGDQALGNGSMSAEPNRVSLKLPASGTYTISVYMMRSAARRNESSNFTLTVSISAASRSSERPTGQDDYADGLQGGPDFWEINRDPASATPIRSSPAASAAKVVDVAGGTILRNQGCRMAEGSRWCKVSLANAPEVSGWIDGNVLRESSRPPSAPQTHVAGTQFHATGNVPCARNKVEPMGSCRFGVVRKSGGGGAVTVFWPDGQNRVVLFENGAPASFDKSQADGDARLTYSRDGDLFTVRIGDQMFQIPEAVITGG